MNDQSGFPPCFSFWEIREFLTGIDLAVVGSGIVGLTTAIFYKRRHPHKTVVVLERGFLPSGASTKNAGFACFGSASELLADLQHTSEEEVIRLLLDRWNGLLELRKLLGDSAIDFTPCGGYELFLENNSSLFEPSFELGTRLNRELEGTFNNGPIYSIQNDASVRFGFQKVDNIILNKYEGSVDTGKMMNALIRLAQKEGVRILNGMDVRGFEESGKHISVFGSQGLLLKAEQIHVATNGFAKLLFPNLDVAPARAQVLISTPVADLKLSGTFHLEEGYYYFRNVGNRILLGGGRNLDVDSETTTELNITARIQNKLDDLLREVIAPNERVSIEHRWAGVMGIGKDKRPIVERLSDRLSCSVKMGGMGVALGTAIGKRSAEMLSR